MDEKKSQKNFIKRRNKKTVTVNESIKPKKVLFHHKHSNSEKKKSKQINPLIFSVEAINLITKGPSINKLFFKNDSISLKSESVPKPNKKGVKKYRSINVDKGKNAIYNNIKLQKPSDSNLKFSNNALNYFNIDTVEKMHDLKGSAKDFYQYYNYEENNCLKKSKKPNYINKNCLSNDTLKIYTNNNINQNPIMDFLQPMQDNEIKKKQIQKIKSIQKEKKNYRCSDFKIKCLKEEDKDDSLDNINPDDYRGGKETNIELISNNSYKDNDVSSSLSSIEEDEQNSPKNKQSKKKDQNNKKLKNNKIEKNSDKNIQIQNTNDIDENYFKNDFTLFASSQIYSNHTSNKSLKSDYKGDYFNNSNYELNGSHYYNNNNNDNINKNYPLENMISKSVLKKIISINSNTDVDRENEEENEITEKLNQSNNLIDNINTNKSSNNFISSDLYNNKKNPAYSQINNNVINNNINNQIPNINNNYNNKLNNKN